MCLAFDPAPKRVARMTNRGRILRAPVEPRRDARLQVRQILHTQSPQAKLTVGPPGDAYEREADRVADTVMRMPDPALRERHRQRFCPARESTRQARRLGVDSSPTN